MEKLNKKLTREHIDFRVGQIIKAKDIIWCTLLAYKDARVDMQILDEAVGQLNWQNEYKRDSKGVLQCGIAIFNNTTNQWIWKWSNGTESNMDSQKGEYSDAFKRAGFMWGIGRKLYDFPTIFVQLTEAEFYVKDNKAKATSKLRPNNWIWEISEDYKTVIAKSKINGNLVERFNSNPYNKK